MTNSTLARRSPLHERHVALGAKMADFGGWDMPIEYPGGGVVAEHTAVRERVGIFDVSHLGKATVSGTGAADFVNGCFTNDLRRIQPGSAQYTICCNETGGAVDDLIAYLRSDEDVFLIPNAANTTEVVGLLTAAAPDGISVTNRHEEFGIIAVQGPRCDELLQDLGLPTGHPYMSFVDTEWRGQPLTVCRTGYTGERGYEIVVPWDAATEVWDALGAAMEPMGGLPCGLGARDTLRTEMGYALHGQDLSPEISPVQARVGWAVGWKKESFWGRDALIAERGNPSRISHGLLVTGRGIPRAHCAVSRGTDPVGEVTSGTFSPTLKQGIALALLAPDVAVGDTVTVDIRGRGVEATVVKPPFIEVKPS